MSDLQAKASLEKRYDYVLDWLYGGDRDVEIKYRTFRAVRPRYVQPCSGAYHLPDGDNMILPGTLCIVERAWVSEYNGFRSCYTCKGCIRKAEKDLL